MRSQLLLFALLGPVSCTATKGPAPSQGADTDPADPAPVDSAAPEDTASETAAPDSPPGDSDVGDTGGLASVSSVTLSGTLLLPEEVAPVNVMHRYLTVAGSILAPIDPAGLDLSELVTVVAVPLPPPGGPSEELLLDGQRIRPDLQLYRAEVSPSGEFSVRVAPYEHGYLLAASAARTHLKRWLDAPVRAGEDLAGLDLDLTTTTVANAALILGAPAEGLDSAAVEGQLGEHLAGAEDALREALVGALSTDSWWEQAWGAVEAAGGPVAGEARGPLLTLMSAEEITSLKGAVQIGFDTEEAALGDQHLAQGLRFYANAPDATGAPSLSAQGGEGLAELPAGVSLDLIFPEGVHSVGLELQSGAAVREGAAASPRRPFRFLVYDTGGSLLQELRWHTSQRDDAPGFYGVTSVVAPIGRVQVLASGEEPLAFDGLVFSEAPALLPYDGWRPEGLWRHVTSGADDGDFNHQSREATEAEELDTDGDGLSDICSYSHNHSAAAWFEVPYGAHPEGGSPLVSPGFTLTNLPLSADDAGSFSALEEDLGLGSDYWLVGSRDGVDELENITTGDCLRYKSDCPLSMERMSGAESWASKEEELGLTLYSMTMVSHWSHLHFQSYADIEQDALLEDTETTRRLIDYSTDNGATWSPVFWFRDDEHRGLSGRWWWSHMHPFPDSDLAAWLAGEPCENTDFDKDGVAEYDFDFDGDGVGASGDEDDCRDWDTEFYQEFPDEPMVDLEGQGNSRSRIMGGTIVYRFRFDTAEAPDLTRCDPDLDACSGWKIDDVALNSDFEYTGYYTSFSESRDPNR